MNGGEVIERKTFTHNGQDYEIRTVRGIQEFQVGAFRNDELVTPVLSVDFMIDMDFEEIYGESAVEQLQDIAKNMVENEHI